MIYVKIKRSGNTNWFVKKGKLINIRQGKGKNCKLLFLSQSQNSAENLRRYGPETIEQYYRNLEKLDVITLNNLYYKKHLNFKKENAIWTKEMINQLLVNKFIRVWNNLKEKRIYLIFFRLFFYFKYPCHKGMIFEKKLENRQNRYNELKRLDRDFQEFFQFLRVLRDQYVFIWVYKNVVQKVINVFFLIYVYTSVLPSSVAFIKHSWLMLIQLPSVRIFPWDVGLLICSTYLSIYFLKFFFNFVYKFYLEIEKENLTFKLLAFCVMLFLLCLGILFVWLLVKEPILFIVIQYFLYSFQLTQRTEFFI